MKSQLLVNIWIAPRKEGWTVRCQHCPGEHSYPQKSHALQFARLHAGSFREGTTTDIVIRGDDGRGQHEWAPSRQPHPPAF
jgi:hypothetical protein